MRSQAQIRRLNIRELTPCLLACLFAVTGAEAGTVAQSPLFISATADPNIMFTLDDSGSMMFEVLPEENIFGENYIFPGAVYMFPRASSVYGASDYTNLVVGFDPANKYTRYLRSSAFNKMYYNPAVTYRPWSNADGSLMPNASPTAAYHNPVNTAAGTRNLTPSSNPSASVYWLQADGTFTNTSKSFYPATYYIYNGGDQWASGSYTQVQIKSTTPTYTGSAARTDCAFAPTCTYAEEIQNFANWYTYYRSRVLTARAGVGRAFASQGQSLRVGFALLNQGSATIDGKTSNGAIVTGLRQFKGTDRSNFFTQLYQHVIDANGTPTRAALDYVGQYFKRADNQGPWGNTPGANDTTPQLACRKSFNLLTTDGYWNGARAWTSGAQNNVDGSNGTSMSGPNPNPPPATLSYQYTAANPYMDGWSNTLADVAMYYWVNDLRSDLANQVPKDDTDPAFWQHLVNFTVGLGVHGTLDPATDLSALTSGSKTWPKPYDGGSAVNVDDTWHAALNSRGQFFSAADPQTLANALSATLNNIVARGQASSSAVATNSTQFQTNTLLYQARFSSSDWSGQLLAYLLVSEDTNGNGQLDPGEDTNGNGILDSGLIGPLAWDAGTRIPASTSRAIYSYNPAATGTKGIEFQWTNLNDTQKQTLDNASQTAKASSSPIVDYLRGNQSKETKNGGTYRSRSVLLGDIVNSDPLFVGTQNYGYSVLPGTEGTSYQSFQGSASFVNRRKMIYVGANDGMLHGIDAGTSVDGGKEIFAYMPNAVISPELVTLTNPGYGSSSYPHKYFVDGAPQAGDAYFGGAWHTILVGSMGAGGTTATAGPTGLASGTGGMGIFALDVTNPDDFATLATGAGKVLWEFSSRDDADLGYTLPQSSIGRMYDGRFAAIVANGYDSPNGKAVLFVIDIQTGSVLKKIDTGTTGGGNGLSTPITVDSDNDRIVDYIYAGDLKGNLWKFDVTSSDPTQWGVAYGGSPLFVAKDNATTPATQPITSKPQVSKATASGQTSGVMVYFGTGKYFEDTDNRVPASPQVQTFYGIWDVCDKTNSVGCDGRVSGRSALQQQAILAEGTTGTTTIADGTTTSGDVRVTSDCKVTYGSTAPTDTVSAPCTNDANRRGWFMDLLQPPSTAQDEMVISAPILRNGLVIFPTLIPSTDLCIGGGASWLMELDQATGARLADPPFDVNRNGAVTSADKVIFSSVNSGVPTAASGLKSTVGIIKTPAVISCGSGLDCKYASGSTGALLTVREPAPVTQTPPPSGSPGSPGKRLSWRQLR